MTQDKTRKTASDVKTSKIASKEPAKDSRLANFGNKLKQFKKGNKGGGRPKGATNIANRFEDALREVAKEKKGLDLVKHFIRRAYEEDSVLCAVMKKMLPDLIKKDDEGQPTQIVYVGIPLSKTGEIPANLPPEVRAAVVKKLAMNGSANGNGNGNGSNGHA